MKPCAVPRIQPVGDDIARLTDTFESGDRGQPRSVGASGDRCVGGLLFADGVEADPAQHTVVIGRKRFPGTSAPVREPQTVPRAHQRSAFDVAVARSAPRCGHARGRRQASVGARQATSSTRRPGAARPWRDLRARREHEPVAARAALRTRERRADHRRIGVAVGGLLRRPASTVEVFGTARLWRLAAQIGQLAHRRGFPSARRQTTQQRRSAVIGNSVHGVPGQTEVTEQVVAGNPPVVAARSISATGRSIRIPSPASTTRGSGVSTRAAWRNLPARIGGSRRGATVVRR